MSISSIAKAVWRKEPAILAGLIAAGTWFFSTKYGSNADGQTQGLGSGIIFLIFTTLRQFVTSTAGRDLLTRAQTNLPGFVDDVREIVTILGPIRKARGGPAGYVKALEDVLATHRGQLENDAQDVIARVRGVIRGSTTGPAPATLAETPILPTVGNGVPEATLAAPGGLEGAAADLGVILGVKAAA